MREEPEGREVWAWGDLFQLHVPANVSVSDREHAVEFVPQRKLRADDAAPAPDVRESARAWLSVFGPESGASSDAVARGITRFAGTVGVALSADAIAHVDVDGVSWGRADFDGADGDAWQVVAIAWNSHLVLFMMTAVASDPEFAAAMDALLASFRALDPVIADRLPADEDGDF